MFFIGWHFSQVCLTLKKYQYSNIQQYLMTSLCCCLIKIVENAACLLRLLPVFLKSNTYFIWYIGKWYDF